MTCTNSTRLVSSSLAGVLAVLLGGVGYAAISMSASASTYTVLYTTKGGTDGSGPVGPLVLTAGGVLYGISADGGTVKTSGPCMTYGCGYVFALTPKTKIVKGVPVTSYTKTVLYKFPGNAGLAPRGPIALGPDGSIYGTLPADYNSKLGQYVAGGYVFKLTPPASGKGAWKETSIHHFTGGEGSGPQGATMDSQGNLYGVLTNGNGSPVWGEVYSLTPSGGSWTESTVHVFDQPGDYTPNVDLTFDSSGALYGSNTYGGLDGVGQIFRITLSPVVSYSVIHEFTGSPSTGGVGGTLPYSSIVPDANGVFYGTTFYGGTGGTGGAGSPGGVAYSLAPPVAPATDWSFNVLYNFDFNAESLPRAGLNVDPSGVVYGLASSGFRGNSYGAVFGLYPPAGGQPSWTETDLFDLSSAADGADPSYRMVPDGAGAFYGSASPVIFKFIP